MQILIPETVWLALIVAIPAMLSPLLLSWLTNRNNMKVKDQEFARQDQVAKQAETASLRLLESQRETTRALEDSTRSAIIARQRSHSQLTAIHTLVNSNMTMALQAELDSTRRELAALEEIREIKREAGTATRGDATIVIAAAKQRVAELELIMIERRSQDKIAKAQIDKSDAQGIASDAAALAAPAAAEKAVRTIVPPVVGDIVPPVVKEAVRQALDEKRGK